MLVLIQPYYEEKRSVIEKVRRLFRTRERFTICRTDILGARAVLVKILLPRTDKYNKARKNALLAAREIEKIRGTKLCFREDFIYGGLFSEKTFAEADDCFFREAIAGQTAFLSAGNHNMAAIYADRLTKKVETVLYDICSGFRNVVLFAPECDALCRRIMKSIGTSVIIGGRNTDLSRCGAAVILSEPQFPIILGEECAVFVTRERWREKIIGGMLVDSISWSLPGNKKQQFPGGYAPEVLCSYAVESGALKGTSITVNGVFFEEKSASEERGGSAALDNRG